MADKTAPPTKQEHEKQPPEGTLQNSSAKSPKSAENGVGDEAQARRRDIFAERFSATMDGFGEACEKQGVTTAIAIAMHPEEDMPLVFVRGHEYDVAVLLARMLRSMKEKLGSELDA